MIRDDERIRGHLDHLVRGTVEETLNALLDAEADRLCNVSATSARRRGVIRGLATTSAASRPRPARFGSRCRSSGARRSRRRLSSVSDGREASVEEALIEMHLAGVSVRRVEDITEALWARGSRPRWFLISTYATIDAWRNRPIAGERPYTYLDGIVMKRNWAGEVRNVSLLVAIAVNSEGYREIPASSRAPRRTRRAGPVS
jgi:transposase-like protein